MKRVVLAEQKPVEIVCVDQAVDAFYEKKIIAYETAKKNGLAVLRGKGTSFGFCYHSDLVCRQDSWANNMKYRTESVRDSLVKAVAVGREVFIFDSFNEFAKHAGNLCDY